MTRDQIKAIALASGFTERQQADGSMDLNGYVYAFAEEMYAEGQRAMQERVGTLCDELEQHWSDYKDTALNNGNVALSNAASGEPRAARAIKAAVLMMEVKPS